MNPYTCRLLIRIDWFLYLMKGKTVFWDDGVLCERMPPGHGVELSTHFPGKWFVVAAYLQNRYPWTRRILSA